MSETRLEPEGIDQPTLMRTIIAGVLISVVLSIMSPLLLVCLVPLQWIYYKAGSRNALISSAVSLILMVGVQLVAYRIMYGQMVIAAVFDCTLPIAMIAGLLMLNFHWKAQLIPAWLKIILAYGLILAVIVPAADIAFRTPEMHAQFEAVFSAISTSFGSSTINKDLLDISLELLIRFLPVVFLVIVLFNWYAATWFWRRRRFQWSANSALANFRIAEYMVWPLLFGLTGVAFSQVVKLPLMVERIAVLISLGFVFIYFLQGLGIIAAFFERRRNPESRPLSLFLVCMILFMTPVVNVIALVVIPLLGVLEIWIHMRPATHV